MKRHMMSLDESGFSLAPSKHLINLARQQMSPTKRYSYLGKLERALLLICLFAYTASLLAGQAVHPVTGRRIASVMGITGADWLDRSERDEEEQSGHAIELLDLKPGMMVGDVGAGTGYYSLRIAKKVAPNGKVYAVDIQPPMLERLQTKAGSEHISNIQTVLGTESDPRLPPNKLDLVILVDVYHEFSRPQRMLEHIRTALKPTGRLVLLEYRKEDPTVPIRPEHKMSVNEVKQELTPEGYTFEKVDDSLPWQHILYFKRSAVN